MKLIKLSILLYLSLFTSMNVIANDEEIEEEVQYIPYLYRIQLGYIEADEGSGGTPEGNIPNQQEDHDGDGVPNSVDTDHPASNEENYETWTKFMNAFCEGSTTDMNDVVSMLSSSVSCVGFSRMPDEELPAIIISSLGLQGNSQWSSIAGMSNVLEINSFSITSETLGNSLNIAQLSDIQLGAVFFDGVRLSGVLNIGNDMSIWRSEIGSLTVSTISSSCCIELREAHINTLNINSTNPLNALYLFYGSTISSINMLNNQTINSIYWEPESNLNGLNGVLAQRIYIYDNQDLTNINGLSDFLSQPTITDLIIQANGISDFSVLSNIRNVSSTLEIMSNSFDARILENLISANNLSIGSVAGEFGWNFTNPIISNKADSTSSFCQGILNGNINLENGNYSTYCN